MKRFTLFGAVLTAAVAVLAGCNPVENPTPKFSSGMDGDLRVPAGESKGEINYVLENAAEDGFVEAKSNLDGEEIWITDFDYSQDGTVAFNIAANGEEQEREAVVTLTYSYSGGKDQSFAVKVIQAAKGADPVLTLTSEAEINADEEGGDYEITFTLENPTEDGELKAESDEWITTVVEEAKVAVSIDPNEKEEAREGKVTVTYNWAGGEPLHFDVIVKQPAKGGNYPNAFNIEVPEDQITATSAMVRSSCNYSELTWTSQIMSQEQLDTYCGGDRENMKEYFLELLEEKLADTGIPPEIALPLLLYPGDKVDEFTYSVTPETHFLTFAVAMDYQMNYTTDFYWGPEFTTPENTDPEPGGLTFEIVVEPKKTSAIMSVYPSDKSAKYLATALDESFFTSGLTDEEIMSEIISQMSFLILFMLDQGDVVGTEVTGMIPGMNYYAVAFGVDTGTYSYSSVLAKEPFTTLPSEDTDAYVTGSADNYWDINDLIAYNPEYESIMKDESTPVLVAIDFEYNETATGCYYALFVGDVTQYGDQEELYTQTLLAQKTAKKGDAAPMFYQAFGQMSTLVTIAKDANDNLGEMYTHLITLTEDGKSTNYALFDEYYNATMNQSAASVASEGNSLIMVPSEFIVCDDKEREVLTYDGKLNLRLDNRKM